MRRCGTAEPVPFPLVFLAWYPSLENHETLRLRSGQAMGLPFYDLWPTDKGQHLASSTSSQNETLANIFEREGHDHKSALAAEASFETVAFQIAARDVLHNIFNLSEDAALRC